MWQPALPSTVVQSSTKPSSLQIIPRVLVRGGAGNPMTTAAVGTDWSCRHRCHHCVVMIEGLETNRLLLPQCAARLLQRVYGSVAYGLEQLRTEC